MNHRIYDWNDISCEFNDTILLGNGASIAIDSSFGYGSLKKHAIEQGLLINSVQGLYEYFETDDFELILRLVWQSNRVNLALGIEDSKTNEAYEHVRDCLIRTVQSIHPSYNDVESQLYNIARFLSEYSTVLSLNYDLTLYWTIMYANRVYDGHTFKDCFVNGEFDSDWYRFRKSISSNDKKITLVFYPHGNLVLARNVTEDECKLESRAGSDLLSSILHQWESGKFIPLFVSEGTSKQKMKSIQNSHYLNAVFREVIPDIRDNLTIFGWGLGEHDIHILRRIKESGVTQIAVSVFNNDQAYCNRVLQMIYDNVDRDICVKFFNCKSRGCWNVSCA